MCDEKDERLALKIENTPTTDIQMSAINNENISTNNEKYNKNVELTSEFGIDISNATAKWTSDQPENTLNNINLTVKPGRLVAIIGPVGAGKVFIHSRSIFISVLHVLTDNCIF